MKLGEARALVNKALERTTDPELLRVIAWLLERAAIGALDPKVYKVPGTRDGFDVRDLEGLATMRAAGAIDAILSLLGMRSPIFGLPVQARGAKP